MSFTLSNLGDFASALRETKRALALDPMYTPQKLELAIELPHEEIRLTVAPPITEKDESVDRVADFHFDPAIIEELFAEKPARLTPTGQSAMTGYTLARDLITKGLYDRAQWRAAHVRLVRVRHSRARADLCALWLPRGRSRRGGRWRDLLLRSLCPRGPVDDGPQCSMNFHCQK